MVLADIANLIRSKNAGPFILTFDIMFADLASYRRVKDSGALNTAAFAKLYCCPVEKVRAAFHYVRTGQTVTPETLPGADDLIAMLEAA